jgi:hypothetical protein
MSASTSSIPSSKCCQLLELPRELRDMIFEYALTEKDGWNCGSVRRTRRLSWLFADGRVTAMPKPTVLNTSAKAFIDRLEASD